MRRRQQDIAALTLETEALADEADAAVEASVAAWLASCTTSSLTRSR